MAHTPLRAPLLSSLLSSSLFCLMGACANEPPLADDPSAQGDFSLSLSGGNGISVDQTAEVAINIARSGNFTAPVELSLDDAPPSLRFHLSANPVSGKTSILALNAVPCTIPGTFHLVLRGTSGQHVHTLPISVIIRPGQLGQNLIVNGDAESGSASPDEATPVAIPGWNVNGNFTVVSYGDPVSSAPTPTDPGPPESLRGKQLFVGGYVNELSSATQLLDLSACAVLIDQGRIHYELSGYLGGYSGQQDAATLTATLRELAMTPPITIGPVTATDRSDQTGLLLRSAAGTLPAGTRTLQLTLSMQRIDGSFNDGYADNLSFILTPEP